MLPSTSASSTRPVGASFVTLALRKRAMRRWGQTPTGLVEDALVLGSTYALVGR